MGEFIQLSALNTVLGDKNPLTYESVIGLYPDGCQSSAVYLTQINSDELSSVQFSVDYSWTGADNLTQAPLINFIISLGDTYTTSPITPDNYLLQDTIITGRSNVFFTNPITGLGWTKEDLANLTVQIQVYIDYDGRDLPSTIKFYEIYGEVWTGSLITPVAGLTTMILHPSGPLGDGSNLTFIPLSGPPGASPSTDPYPLSGMPAGQISRITLSAVCSWTKLGETLHTTSADVILGGTANASFAFSLGDQNGSDTYTSTDIPINSGHGAWTPEALNGATITGIGSFSELGGVETTTLTFSELYVTVTYVPTSVVHCLTTYELGFNNTGINFEDIGGPHPVESRPEYKGFVPTERNFVLTQRDYI